MSAVFIVTPSTETSGLSWQPELQRLQRALGIGVQSLPLGEPVPDGATVLPLLAWGYHLNTALWFDAIASWERAGARVINSPSVLRWNTRKTYLVELQAKGLPVVPSIAIDVVTTEALADARRAFGVEKLVLKPQIGAMAHGAVVTSSATTAFDEPAIIQPFVASIAEEGELSLMFFDGVFSHAVRKRPSRGDFRVQEEHGGETTPIDAPAEALAAAHAVLAHTPAKTIYVRVDLVAFGAADYRLMELELIEPQLFLAHAPDGGARLGEAVRAAIAARAAPL